MISRISNIENANSYTGIACIGMLGSLNDEYTAVDPIDRSVVIIHELTNDDSYDSYTKNLALKWEPHFYQNDLEKELSHLFSKLEAAQQPLGHKFEEVLFKNLWDLYD